MPYSTAICYNLWICIPPSHTHSMNIYQLTLCDTDWTFAHCSPKFTMQQFVDNLKYISISQRLSGRVHIN